MSARPGSGCGIAGVAIDARLSSVVVPAGVGLDPGGIGKGLAADIVVTELLVRGTQGVLLSIGGDVAAAGTPPTAEGWHIAVEHPLDSTRNVTTLVLDAGGVATSSTVSRTWSHDGCRRHHVIDPETRTCSKTDLAATTVVARAGWEAEAHATAALMAGSELVLEYLDDQRLDGIAVALDGTISMSASLEGAVLCEGSRL